MEVTLVELLRTTFDRTVTLLEALTGEPRWVGDYDILIKIRMSRGSIVCDVVGLISAISELICMALLFCAVTFHETRMSSA